MPASGTNLPDLQRGESLYFFPDQPMTASQLKHLLAEGAPERRAWAVSHLLRYADWDDIWTFVSRDEVRELFPSLDLPPTLRTAWARILKVEAAATRTD
jgi:hypothetical protein